MSPSDVPDTDDLGLDDLLRALDDLDREHAAGDLSDEDYAELRDHYTALTANEVRDDAHATARQDVAANDPTANRSADSRPGRRRASPLRRIAVGAGVIALAVGAGLVVARSAGERIEGQGLTGSVKSISNDRRTQVDALMEEARAKLGADNFSALRAYDRALELDPELVEAAAYGAWIVRLTSTSVDDDALRGELQQAALKRIERAISIDPRYPDARAFRGIMRLRDFDDPKGALDDFKVLEAVDVSPFAKQLVAGARVEAAELLAETSATTAPTTAG